MGQDEIRPFDGDLIFLGKIEVSLSIDLELSRLIVLGHVFGLGDETVIIVACLSLKSLFKVRSILHSSPSSLQESISFRRGNIL
jgi:HrpA-like RNA helicase